MALILTTIILALAFLIALIYAQEKQAAHERRAVIEILTRHIADKWSDRG
jgi:Tfp pilus assembly protein PilV